MGVNLTVISKQFLLPCLVFKALHYLPSSSSQSRVILLVLHPVSSRAIVPRTLVALQDAFTLTAPLPHLQTTPTI